MENKLQIENPVIRDATIDDYCQLADLMKELGYSTTETEMHERLSSILSMPNYKTICMEINKEIVAMVGMIHLYFWEQNGCFIKIQVFVVKEKYWRNGLGKKLMQACETYGKSVGAKLLALTSGNRTERKVAHIFYPAIGFEASSIGYIKKIQNPNL